MLEKQLRGVIVSVYGVLLDIFSIHNLIPLFAEDHLSDSEETMLIWWIILWVASTIILGIGSSIIKSANTNTTNTNNQTKASAPIPSSDPLFVKCPSCGEDNSSKSNHCYKCGTSLQSHTNGNEWKCPSCGRINQNYVGTCGCGQVKPN